MAKNESAAPPTTDTLPVSVVEALIEKIAQIQTGGNGLTADGLKTILESFGQSQAEAIGRMVRPENTVHPGISAYSYPEGELKRPKPRLSRETFFCGVRMSEDTLTPAEIIAFNNIQQDCTARNGVWKAFVRKNGNTERLLVSVPSREIDQRMEVPSLVAVLTELAEGPNAVVNLEKLAAELADLKDRLARAEGQKR